MPELRDRSAIRAMLMRDPELHLYELGDLDDFFWPRTRWFAQGSAIALLYDAPDLPVILALDRDAPAELAALLCAETSLPARAYAHLSPEITAALASCYAIEPHGPHLKMALRDRGAIDEVDVSSVVALGTEDLEEIAAFYRSSYPGNWFDARMLATRQYFGIRESGALVAIGGVHVYSASERVAALGNIATAPHRRGSGLATKVTARLCRSLLESVDRVGLNVLADNAAAIRCYERLGFARVAPYDEAVLERRAP